MRQHQTLSVSQQFKEQMEQQCPRHNTNQLDLFCGDCNLSICSTCFSKEHNKHKCCGLEEKMETFSSELDRVLVQTDRVLEAIHNVIKVTQGQAVKVKADITNLKQKTSAAYRAIQRHVDELEECHLSSIDDCYQRVEKVIAETRNKQETLQAGLHSIQLYGQHLPKGSEHDLTLRIRSLVKRSEEEMSKSIPELRWKVDITWSDWEVKGEVDRVSLVREGEVNVENDQQLTSVSRQSLKGNRTVRHIKNFIPLNMRRIQMLEGWCHIIIICL